MRINKLTLLLLAPMCLFSCNKGVSITLLNENEDIGYISKGGNYNPGTTLVLEAKVKDDKVGKYLFGGWYKVEGDKEYSESFQNPWIYTVPNNSVTYKVKWDEYSTQQFIFNYLSESNSFSVSRYFGTDKEIIIPKTHYGLPVTSIDAYTFAGLKNADSIKIHEGITSIGDYAFMNSNLKEITLSDNLSTTQGDNIFIGWTKNQTIKLTKNTYSPTGKQREYRSKWGWYLEEIYDEATKEYTGLFKESASSEPSCGSKEVIFELLD